MIAAAASRIVILRSVTQAQVASNRMAGRSRVPPPCHPPSNASPMRSLSESVLINRRIAQPLVGFFPVFNPRAGVIIHPQQDGERNPIWEGFTLQRVHVVPIRAGVTRLIHHLSLIHISEPT